MEGNCFALHLKGEGGLRTDFYCVQAISEYEQLIVFCSGHGKDGEAIAKMSAKMIPTLLVQHGFYDAKKSDAAKAAFADLDRRLKSLDKGGTSAMIQFICPEYIFIAYVGDITAHLVFSDCHVGVTRPHLSSSPMERRGLITRSAEFARDGDVLSREGLSGLNLSRSLGDPSYNKILSSEPEIRFIPKYTGTVSGILVGSSFFWEIVDEVAKEQSEPSQIAKLLLSDEDFSTGLKDLKRKIGQQENWDSGTLIAIDLRPFWV